ncbi:MAG TPA: zinc metallopeptidase [Clostridiaceae bacterium]|nr:zinc metallopeptidase [Clostridiaceae bacterium]
MGYLYGFDEYYLLLVVPALIFSLYAQYKVSSTFSKYQRFHNRYGYTGAEVARIILDNNRLHDVSVQPTGGSLTDHYDPRTRVVRLSQTVYGSTSVAALGVAAHETGHAIQHKIGYKPLVLRSALVPVANIGSMAGPYLAIFGLIFNFLELVYVGILLYAAAVAFYLITLPVEINASKRAVEALETSGILAWDEVEPAKKVLRAAAMTYLASAAVALASLLRLILLANSRRRRD